MVQIPNIALYPWCLSDKESAYNIGDIGLMYAGDMGLIPVLGRSPGEGNGNPLQYSCLDNPMDKEAWQATAHGATKSWTQLSTQTQTHKTQ